MINPEKPYSFNRNYAMREVAFWNGSARKILLHSRTGNGKSIFQRQLMVQLARDGFLVCEGVHAIDTVHDEIDWLRSRGQPLAFLYEAMRENEDAIKSIAAILEPRDILIVSTRPTSFATNYINLRNVLGEGFKRIDLDVLQPIDIAELDTVLSYYGLWTGMVSGTTSGKRNFIRDDCGSELRTVVLHLFKSPSLAARIAEPVKRLILANGEISNLLAALLIIRLADCPIGYEDVCDLFDALPSTVREHFEATGVIDLFPDTDHEFRARSPILSEYVLSELLPPAVPFAALRLLIDRLVDVRGADWRFEESIGRILRFAIITRIFRKPSSRQFIVVLYEELLVISFLREDPQFWLQLAMARSDQLQWVPTRTALDTAYEKAKLRPLYNTYMLDNQMARFLFLNATAGELCDLDADSVRACDLMRPRLASHGDNLDVYAFRLVDPLLQFSDALRPRLGDAA